MPEEQSRHAGDIGAVLKSGAPVHRRKVGAAQGCTVQSLKRRIVGNESTEAPVVALNRHGTHTVPIHQRTLVMVEQSRHENERRQGDEAENGCGTLHDVSSTDQRAHQ